MLTILIYDPDREHAQWMRDAVKSIFIAQHCEIQLTTHTQAESVIAGLQENSRRYDILLLSTTEPKTSLQMAALVRSQNLVSSILFYAKDYKPVLSTLPYRPSAFLTIPLSPERLRLSLLRAQEEQTRDGDFFMVSTKTGFSRIPYEAIEFFQSDQHKLNMFVKGKDECYSFNARLDAVSAKLPPAMFLRCHQSYSINVRHIAGMDKSRKCLLLFSGLEIPISKSYYPRVNAAFTKMVRDKNVG